MSEPEIKELARKLKQRGDTCLLASALFSMAMQNKSTGSAESAILRELERQLESVDVDFSEWDDSRNPRIYAVEYAARKRTEIILNRLRQMGYELEYRPASAGALMAAMEHYPIIHLDLPFPGWSGYIKHVVCAVGLERDWRGELAYFEPLAGEIRKIRPLYFANTWRNIGIVNWQAGQPAAPGDNAEASGLLA